jgi:hypothetical protein
MWILSLVVHDTLVVLRLQCKLQIFSQWYAVYTQSLQDSYALEHQSKFLYFKQANVPAMKNKLDQFDEALRQEIVSPDVIPGSYSVTLTRGFNPSPHSHLLCIPKKSIY